MPCNELSILQARFTVCKSDTTVKFIQYRFQMINLFYIFVVIYLD